jgi:hypothetical protein
MISLNVIRLYPLNVSNEELWQRTEQMNTEQQKRKENGVGLAIHSVNHKVQ